MITINSVREYLVQMDEFYKSHGHTGTPLQYVLAHGREYGPRIFPKRVRKMADKMCFKNAYHLASRDPGLRYAEGYATSIIPVEHAWCVTESGEVVDPTWTRDRPSEYYGVALDMDVVHRVMLITKCYGVFSSWHKWDEILQVLRKEISDVKSENAGGSK